MTLLELSAAARWTQLLAGVSGILRGYVQPLRNRNMFCERPGSSPLLSLALSRQVEAALGQMQAPPSPVRRVATAVAIAESMPLLPSRENSAISVGARPYS